jgi:general secretion pathway protein A
MHMNTRLQSGATIAAEADVNPLAGLVTPADERDVASAERPETADGGGTARGFLEYYGLPENPYADSVNPAYYYKTAAHREACERMLMAVENDTSLGMVTGVSGTGKTLITQLLLQAFDPTRCEPVLVLATPGLSRTGLLREILSELNVALPVGICRTHDLLKMLSHAVIDLHGEGRKLVILVDECHFLDADALHIVRTISNLETPERKLTTCLLFGEQRFVRRLNKPGYESLRNRMYFRSELTPMSAEECAQYVKFRALTAGRAADLFSAEALAAIHAASGGVCRSVNKLCMLALIEGCIRRRRLLDGDVIAACAARV